MASFGLIPKMEYKPNRSIPIRRSLTQSKKAITFEQSTLSGNTLLLMAQGCLTMSRSRRLNKSSVISTGRASAGDARYAIEHPNSVLQSIYGIEEPLYDIDFKVLPAPQYLSRGLYLAFIGLVYLAIGLFVLFRQNRAALTYHFFFWSLLSFIYYFYSSTLEFSTHDRLVSLLDNLRGSCSRRCFCISARISHRARDCLCVRVQSSLRSTCRRSFSSLLKFFGTTNRMRASLLAARSIPVRNLFDQIELFYGAIFFVAGSALLLRTFLRAEKPLLRQQLKWIIWGMGISGLPFAVLYVIPYISNLEITAADGDDRLRAAHPDTAFVRLFDSPLSPDGR